MSDIRPTSPDERLALKAAVRRAVKMAGGGASVAMATRVGETALSKYSAPDMGDHHCPLDVVLDLDREAGAPVILAALASAQGFSLAKSAALAPGCGPAIADIPAIMDPIASAVRHLAAALADGSVSPREAHAIVAAVDAALKPLLNLRNRAEGKMR